MNRELTHAPSPALRGGRDPRPLARAVPVRVRVLVDRGWVFEMWEEGMISWIEQHRALIMWCILIACPLVLVYAVGYYGRQHRAQAPTQRPDPWRAMTEEEEQADLDKWERGR